MQLIGHRIVHGHEFDRPNEGTDAAYKIFINVGAVDHRSRFTPKLFPTVARNLSVRLFGRDDDGKELSTHDLLLGSPYLWRNQTLTVAINADAPLGNLWMIEFRQTEDGYGNLWFLNSVEIKYRQGQGGSWRFPAYRWMTRIEQVRCGIPVLPQNETPFGLLQRQLELERQRGELPFVKHSSEPTFAFDGSFVDPLGNLSVDERWDVAKQETFSSAMIRAGLGQAISAVLHAKEFFFRPNKIEDWANYIPRDQPVMLASDPSSARSDEVFGLQRLQGPSAPHIARLISENKHLENDKFKYSERRVEQIIKMSFKEAINARRFYFTDAKLLDGRTTDPGKYLAPAMALYWVNNQRKLVPVAIQLDQNDPKATVFYSDGQSEPDKDTWLVAKMFVASAELQIHQASTHLLRTHLVNEPLVLATKRQLPSAHPLFKLLRPHCKYTLGINGRARTELIQRGGAFDKIVAIQHDETRGLLDELFKVWRFDNEDPTLDLKRRNITDNPNDLPDYLYRDDATSVFTIIRDFVGELLGHYYKSDGDLGPDHAVELDTDVQAWAHELAHTFCWNKNGFPDRITSLAQLVQLASMFIWIGSGQHAAVNFTQYQSYGYVPIHPAALYKAPPKSASEVTGEKDNRVVDWLPGPSKSREQTVVHSVLATYSNLDFNLVNYPEQMFDDAAGLSAFKRLQQRLTEYEDKVKSDRQNQQWEYLLPSKIPHSTAI